MDTCPERRQDANAPVAHFVQVSLDDDRAVARDLSGGLALLVQVRAQVCRGPPVEAVVFGETPDRFTLRSGRERPGELADRPAELGRPAGPIAVPERHLSGLARRGSHQNPVVRDLLDPPGRGSQQKDLSGPRFEDHFFVELPDAAALGTVISREKHSVESAVRDRSGVDDGDAARALAAANRSADPVPHDAGSELCELVRRIAAGEHVQNALERAAGQLREGRRAPDERIEVFDPGLFHRGDRDDLLREDVERIAGIEGLLDLALAHPKRDGGAGEKVAAIFRKDDAAGDRADGVARPADPLHAGCDRRRRLDLDHEVHRAHVDPELERGRRDDRGKLAPLQPVLDFDPLLARDRAVVGERDLLSRCLVQCGSQPLGEPPAVDEDHRRAVCADELDQTRMDRGPDRATGGRAGGRSARDVEDLAQPRHVLDRDLDRDVVRLAAAGVHDLDRPRLPPAAAACRLPAAQEPGDLFERPLRRREANALQRTFRRAQDFEPFQRQEEVSAALRGDDGVDLVDDDGVDGAQDVPGIRSQEQVERLGRRDQDVRRRPCHPGPVGGGRVARSDRESRHAEALRAVQRRGRGDARDRRPEVPLDVHGESFERRDVEDTAALLLGRLGREHQPVDRGKEGGERFSRAGRREQKRRATFDDRRPPLRLRRGRRRERRLEPSPDRGMEEVERIGLPRHPGILPFPRRGRLEEPPEEHHDHGDRNREQ